MVFLVFTKSKKFSAEKSKLVIFIRGHVQNPPSKIREPLTDPG